MSNVPDLDDEELILKNKILAFQRQLGFRRHMIVRRYDSLSLLNQAVFTKDRPGSRLAKEYNRIVREFTACNRKDRDGAPDYIKRGARRYKWRYDNSIQEREDRLQEIEQTHQSDGEILYRLAEPGEYDRQPDSAEQLVNQAIASGFDQPEAFLKRSQFREYNNDSDGAAEDVWRVLDSEQLSPFMVREAVGRLKRLKEWNPQKISVSRAVATLDLADKLWLAETFNRSRDDLSIAAVLLENVEDWSNPGADLSVLRNLLGLSYVGLGRFADAARLFRETYGNGKDIACAFNLGMAMWGTNGTIDRKTFELVVELDQSNGRKNTAANYFQCMAIAYWAVGEPESAVNYANKSRGALRGRTESSCWRYLRVDNSTFEADLDEIQTMIESNAPSTPRFMSDPTHLH